MKKTMANENKLKPEPDTVYRINIWFWKFTDIFWNPRRHLRNIPLKKGMAVVDYGCGPGRYTLPIAKLVGPNGKAFAVDIQPLAIKTVKEKVARQGLTNIETIMVNSYNTAIQSSSIDMVLLIDTFHLIGDCDTLFREIHRLLKQDGILYMDSGHLKMLKAREIVENTGFFTIVEYRDHDMMCTLKDE